jgi:hypothetical protein
MRILSSLALPFAIHAVSILGLVQSGPHEASMAAFSVAISLPQTTVRVGAEIKLDVVLTNTSKKDLFLTITGNLAEFDYSIKVLDKTGNEPHETKYFRAARGKDSSDPGDRTTLVVAPSTGIRQIKPGDTFTSIVDLSKIYDQQAGTYTVQVERFDENSQTMVRSNTITFTVAP